MTWYDDLIKPDPVSGEPKPTVSAWQAFFLHVRNLSFDDLTLTDNTTNNASTSKHGLCPKLDGDATHFLRSDGLQATPPGTDLPPDVEGFLKNDGSGTYSWTTPAGAGDITGPSSATDGAIALFDTTTGKKIKDSAKTLATTLGSTDATVPTSKAVKDVTDGKAAASHSHAESDVTNLVTDLAGKAAASHTHTEGDITNLTSDLAAKATDTAVIHKATAGEIAALNEKTTPASADLLIIEDSADSNNKKRVQIGNLPSSSGAAVWTSILASITTTPASTSTITTTSDLTSSIKIGYALEYTIGGTVYYGIVTAITSSLITIAGAPLGGTITAISYADKRQTARESVKIYGYWNDGTNTNLIAQKLGTAAYWELGQAALVQVGYVGGSIDTGASQPTININQAGSAVLSSEVTPTATYQKSIVNINTSNYLISKGSIFEVVVASNGTNLNSWNLGVELVWVLI